MIKYSFIVLFVISSILSVYAQDSRFKDYSWTTEIPKYTLSEEDKKYGEITIEDKKSIEIVVDENGAYEYYLWHNITLVNTSDAIERNNTIRLPYAQNTEIVINKLRVIQPDGKIIELTDNDIKEAEDEKEKRKYKYFAVRGLVVGALIERITLKKMEPQLSGAGFDLQFDNPSKWQSFELIYPKFLKFETKTYNITTPVNTDTIDYKYIRKHIQLENIDALNDEKYSNYEANVKSIAYKLTGNYNTGKMNINSFKEIVDKLYPAFNPELTKEDNKALDKFLAKSDINTATTEEEKIIKIEAYLKANYVSGENVNVTSYEIADLLKNKVTNFFGMTKLFCVVFNKLGIKHQEVFTTNRYEQVFDPKFENMNHLDKYLIYFPGYKYLAPTEILSRYPLIPHQYSNNYGLFMKPIEMGGVKIGIGEKKTIEPLDYTYSTDTIDIVIDMTKDIMKPISNYKVAWTGYIADRIQPFMNLIEESEKDKTRKSIMEGFAGDMTDVTVKTENEGVEFYGRKPFIATCSSTNQKLTEKVGTTYLFKLGQVIGRQEEMYQQGTRQTDIDVPHKHVYIRRIIVKLPEGYTLKNTDKIDINKTCMLGDEIAARFITKHVIENNQLIITNEESYRLLNLPKDKYEEFRSVINAAADFNKVVLILEPK
jgi:hypothetical protein